MPNTPGLIGAGITGFIFAKDANLEDKEIIEGAGFREIKANT